MDSDDQVHMLRYAADRVDEIRAMQEQLATVSGVKLAFQRLPRHMRRRNMSHNVRRLPRRLREAHQSQMRKSWAGLAPTKQKRPSRKHRRRPTNLMSEYARRQRRICWLNTHIWHAKRFHMVDRWGYRIPYAPCDKSFRACYRASVRHCFAQDISFIACIELVGQESDICAGFERITDCPATGLSIKAKSVINGNRQGEITIFHEDTRIAIGPVLYNWKPRGQVDDGGGRKLWVWVHAAFYDEVLLNFNKFSNVTINELRNEVSRFRLRGELATAALKISLVSQNPDYFHEHIFSAGDVSPGTVIDRVVGDPRYNFPSKRTKVQYSPPNNEDDDTLPAMSVEIDNPLWHSEKRKQVGAEKQSNAEVEKYRSTLLVPGSTLHDILEKRPDIVPVMFLQNPGNGRGIGVGWDVVVPSSWAHTFWMALILRGCRPAGLRASNHLRLEQTATGAAVKCSPSSRYRPIELLPDTAAGKAEDMRRSLAARSKYFGRPPNKRTNYSKLAVASPLCFQWERLVRDWRIDSTGGLTDFFVMRDSKVLQNLQNLLYGKANATSSSIDFSLPALVPIRLTFTSAGMANRYSMICLPENKDAQIKRGKIPSVVEHLRQDANITIRNKLRAEHRKIMLSCRRKRVQAKKNGKRIPVDKSISQSYNEKMERLWIPELDDIENLSLRNSTSRQLIGWISQGDFSFGVGGTVGLGYVALGSMAEMFKLNTRGQILVRATNSLQYRWATIDVIV